MPIENTCVTSPGNRTDGTSIIPTQPNKPVARDIELGGPKMLKRNKCKLCGSEWHTAWTCRLRSKKGKRLQPIGKQGKEYIEFRNNIAYPYLVSKYGERCNNCGKTGVPLDVDHIKKRGSHPDMKYNLKNLALMCRPCHSKKDNEV